MPSIQLAIYNANTPALNAATAAAAASTTIIKCAFQLFLLLRISEEAFRFNGVKLNVHCAWDYTLYSVSIQCSSQVEKIWKEKKTKIMIWNGK